MDTLLAQKIDSLPPLPKTVLELEEFKKSPDKQPTVLVNIIEQDPLIVATLLKVSNSAMFGFRSSVETPSRAVNLLGINFTLSIAFGSSIKNMIDTDLGAYGIGSDDFLDMANMGSNLLSLWVSKIDYDLKEELLLPVFLQETGKFIISDIIKEQGKKDAFLAAARSAEDVSKVEKEYLAITTSSVTASIFKKWNLNESLINAIEFVDNIEACPEKYLKKAQILNVVKTICNVTDPLSDKNVALGVAKAKKFGLDTNSLQKAIEKMQDRMLDA